MRLVIGMVAVWLAALVGITRMGHDNWRETWETLGVVFDIFASLALVVMGVWLAMSGFGWL